MIQGDGADKAAVRTVIAVVAHTEDISLRNGNFAFAAVIHFAVIDIRFVQGRAVAPYLAVMEGKRVAALADNAFDPHIFRLQLMIEESHVVM